jgi:hypothetical protein
LGVKARAKKPAAEPLAGGRVAAAAAGLDEGVVDGTGVGEG